MTARTKHTPGPDGESYGPWFADPMGTIKRQRYDYDGNPDGYVLLDGAYPREWAAAPDLYAALGDLLADCERETVARLLLMDNARAALAKAVQS